MYRSRNSYPKNNRFGRNRRRFGRPRRRKTGAIKPSMLISKAVKDIAKTAYVAKNKFSDFMIDKQLKHNVLARGYNDPTPIQDQIIPHILEGKDVIGIANTGTGKTAAFLIPLIHKLSQNSTKKVLIMTPTRELAVQIESEFKIFARNMRLYSTLCIGGANMYRQINSLRRNPHIVIGTPGRLMDLEKRKVLNFNDFSTMVLDEVDQMMDMGFVDDMKYVISRLPSQRHSLFFSATLPKKMDEIVYGFLDNPIKIRIETRRASDNVDQDIVRVKGRNKIELLHQLLIKEGFDKVLVFGRTKRGLDQLAGNLYDRGFKVATIHGNKSQNQRQRSLRQFRDNYVKILLATDVASRGLDIDNVTHVINYDLPETYEDYIHRIGRTGRANKSGTALSFID